MRNVALVPSTSLALNIAADSVPLGEGDNVVTTDLEFMSVVVPFLEKCRANSAELKVVRHQGGRIEPGRVVDAMTDRTRAVVISSVQWTNGFRINLQPISDACRRRGVPLIVDAIQQLGAVPLDVRKTPVDFLAAGGHKWLGSPSALGLAYASDMFAERYRPALSYVPTSKPPDGTWQTSWTDPAYDPIQTYDLKADASRFEMGVHHAAQGAAGFGASVNLLLEAGPDAIRDHVLGLAARVAEGVAALGYQVVTPLEDSARSGITAFRAGLTPQEDIAMRAALKERNIDVSVRFTSGVGGVRVATHVYNDDGDVDALLDALKEIRGR